MIRLAEEGSRGTTHLASLAVPWSLAAFTGLVSALRSAALGVPLGPGLLTNLLPRGARLNSLCLYGTMVVSGGQANTIKVWSLAGDGECVATLANGFDAKSLAISPRGFIVACDHLGQKLEVWRA